MNAKEAVSEITNSIITPIESILFSKKIVNEK